MCSIIQIRAKVTKISGVLGGGGAVSCVLAETTFLQVKFLFFLHNFFKSEGRALNGLLKPLSEGAFQKWKKAWGAPIKTPHMPPLKGGYPR